MLEAKVRGKLFSIENPRFALVINGRVSADLLSEERNSDWTLMRASAGGSPKPEIYRDLATLLAAMRK